jgi:hypothetical protein
MEQIPAAQGIFQHVARQPGVLADDDTVAMGAVLDQKGDGAAHLHGDFGGHRVGVGLTADAVGAEQGSHLFIEPRVVPV